MLKKPNHGSYVPHAVHDAYYADDQASSITETDQPDDKGADSSCKSMRPRYAEKAGRLCLRRGGDR